MSRLWFVGLGLHAIGILCLVGGSVAFGTRETNIGVLLVLAAVAFLFPGYVVWKIEGKRSEKKLDALAYAMDNMSLISVDEQRYDWLDRTKMRAWASQLDAMGFTLLGDYGLGVPGVVDDIRLPDSLIRLMGNCKDICYAEICQTRPSVGEAKPISCALLTIFESGDELRTTNAQMDRAAQQSAVANMPYVHFEFEPGASVSTLLSSHLEQRDKLAAEKGLSLQRDVSAEIYIRQADSHMAKMREHIAGLFEKMRAPGEPC